MDHHRAVSEIQDREILFFSVLLSTFRTLQDPLKSHRGRNDTDDL